MQELISRAREGDLQAKDLVHQMRAAATPILRGHVEQPDQDNKFRAFMQLPLEQRKQVIEALAKCPELINSDYDQQLKAVGLAGAKRWADHSVQIAKLTKQMKELEESLARLLPTTSTIIALSSTLRPGAKADHLLREHLG